MTETLSIAEQVRMFFDLQIRSVQSQTTERGWLYRGPYDLILQHGREFKPRGLPKGIRQMRPKMCYWNAYELAKKHPGKLTYVEGIGVNILPCSHAWCVDDDGNVVDPTWGSKGVYYIGIPFQLSYVKQIVGRRLNSCPVIENWRDDYPLCSGRQPLADVIGE